MWALARLCRLPISSKMNPAAKALVRRPGICFLVKVDNAQVEDAHNPVCRRLPRRMEMTRDCSKCCRGYNLEVRPP